MHNEDADLCIQTFKKLLMVISSLSILIPELGGHGHVLNGHRCPCPRHGHGRGMDTKFLENRGVDMDMDTEFFENRGVDMDMDTA